MGKRTENEYNTQIEGRNNIREAYRAEMTIDKLFVQDGLKDAPVRTLVSMARKAGTIVNFVGKEVLDGMTQTGQHQGVIAYAAAVNYSTVDEILAYAEEKNEAPFLLILDELEDPHNLGACIRSANVAGAHGVIIPKRHAATVNGTAAKASAGAVHHTKIARVVNLTQTIEDLKAKGIWVICADMSGKCMYDADFHGPVALVIGNEGSGVRKLVREHCDFAASIPMHGEIDSLNASVAAGVLLYEVVRARTKG